LLLSIKTSLQRKILFLKEPVVEPSKKTKKVRDKFELKIIK